MFNIFNSNVLIEVGEKIGDVGGNFFRPKRTQAELVDEIFHRRLETAQNIRLLPSADFVEGDDEYIDVSYRVLGPGDERTP